MDQGARSFELTDIVITEDTFSFKLPSTKAEYSGTRADDGKQVDGEVVSDLFFYSYLDLIQVAEPPKEELQAYWTGKLDAMSQKLDVAFRERKDGTVLFDSLTQQAGGFVASKEVDGTHVVFEVPAVRGTFTGEMNAAGTEIVGKWKQGLIPLSLTLTRSEPLENAYRAAGSPPDSPSTVPVRDHRKCKSRTPKPQASHWRAR